MKKRRILGITLALALCLALLPAAPAAAAVGGVTTYTDVIGGQSATLMSVTMAPGRTGRLVLAGDSVVQDAPDTELVAKAAQGGYTVAAAVNGGFFAAYYNPYKEITFPDNCPQIANTVIVDNHLVNAGGAKPVLGFTADGKAMIDKVGFKPVFRLPSGFAPQAWGTNYNYPAYSDAIMHFTDEMTLPVEMPADSVMYFIQNGKVVNIQTGGTLVVPQNTDVLVYNSFAYQTEKNFEAGSGVQRLPRMGDSVQVDYVVDSVTRAGDKTAWENMETVVGGGPLLLLDGQIATGMNEEFTDPKQGPDYVAQRCFVALTWSGNLVIGTTVGSFNTIAAYLQSNGFKDAIAMDGGASTMLYSANEGMKVPAGRKLASVLAIVDEPGTTPVPEPTPAPGTIVSTGVDPDASGTAYASTQRVAVDDRTVEFQMYALKDAAGNPTNYVKLRDVADALDGSAAKFNVGWNGQVNIETGKAYTSRNGQENRTPYSGDQPYVRGADTTNVDGLAVPLQAFLLTDANGGQSTYYKLRDLGQALGFNVGWNNSGVFIETDQPYNYDD